MTSRQALIPVALLLAIVLPAGVLSASTYNDVINMSGGRDGYSTAILSDPDRVPMLMIQPDGGTLLDDFSFELHLNGAHWDLDGYSRHGIENYGAVDEEGAFTPDMSRDGYLSWRRFPEGARYSMKPGKKDNIMIVTLLPDYPVSPYEAIYIPLLAEITGDRAYVEIYDPGWSGLTDGFYFFSGGGWITSQVRHGAAVEFSGTAALPDITINELIRNGMTGGLMTLTAPGGYRWANIDEIRLAGRNMAGAELAGASYGKGKEGAPDNLSVLNLDLSMSLPPEEGVRTFILKNLQIAPEPDNSEYGPVAITLSGCNMEKETAVVAYRVEGSGTDGGSAPTEETAEKAGTMPVVLTIGSMEMKAGDDTIVMDTAPYIEDGYTMIPVSFAARALGLADDGVVWDGEARTVTLRLPEGEAILSVGSDQLTKNGVTVTIPKAPAIKDGRTFLPFRVLGEQILGVGVEWDGEAGTATFR